MTPYLLILAVIEGGLESDWNYVLERRRSRWVRVGRRALAMHPRIFVRRSELTGMFPHYEGQLQPGKLRSLILSVPQGTGVQIFIQSDSCPPPSASLPHYDVKHSTAIWHPKVRSDGHLVPMVGMFPQLERRILGLKYEIEDSSPASKTCTTRRRPGRSPGVSVARDRFTHSVSGHRCAPGRCQHMCMMTAYHWHWQELASARQEQRVCVLYPLRTPESTESWGVGTGVWARACLWLPVVRVRSQQMRLPELQSRNRWAEPIDEHVEPRVDGTG